ncbi:zf-HC2 domain-containing protein [Bremerella cremea]|uniref:Putative zinc-finger domain-containing protein n=1 Tax=Blastopirellula marina TaxID=124 RepID=A0A2S8G5Z2_9BACT|nr:hypothetical protein C5Y83_03765 [Blastopirellula marina]RCS51334.1 zf-HC2 domain-containing protein [Bremerella cremea]
MSDPETWSPCPSGELSKLQKSLEHDINRRSRRRFLAAGGVFFLATGSLVTWGILESNSRYAHKISCREVLDLRSTYLAGRIESDEKRKLIQAHLAHCPKCRIAYEA